MDNLLTFQDYLISASTNIPLYNFIVNMLITAALTMLLSKIYISYGRTLSNRRLFSNNFLMISLTTMLIITIVKSSLALSLGLVGALSIIRFRAAIKEPEELSYLFLAISIGLGLGANQMIITIVAFIVIAIIIIISDFISKNSSFVASNNDHNIYLKLTSNKSDKIEIAKLIEIIKKRALSLELIRIDEDDSKCEIIFKTNFSDYTELISTKDELVSAYEALQFSIMDLNEI
jgi:hypothetical protein